MSKLLLRLCRSGIIIVVHEAIKYENGFREQKIEIYYRFVGKID